MFRLLQSGGAVGESFWRCPNPALKLASLSTSKKTQQFEEINERAYKTYVIHTKAMFSRSCFCGGDAIFTIDPGGASGCCFSDIRM